MMRLNSLVIFAATEDSSPTRSPPPLVIDAAAFPHTPPLVVLLVSMTAGCLLAAPFGGPCDLESMNNFLDGVSRI